MFRDAAPRLQRMLASYLDGGRNLVEFQREFLEYYVRLPAGALAPGDASFWHEAFGLVTRAASEPADGALGDAELKEGLGGLWRGRQSRVSGIGHRASGIGGREPGAGSRG